MARLIGVHTPLELDAALFAPGILKRELLVWEQIAIPHLASWLPRYHQLAVDENAQGARDLLWLHEQGRVVEIEVDFGAIVAEDVERILAEMGDVFGSPVRKDGQVVAAPVTLERGDPRFRKWNGTVARLGAISARIVMRDADVYPLLEDVSHLAGAGRRLADVATVVIHQLPVPDDLTPYEAIFEYREEQTSADRFRSLRLWINQLAAGTMSPPEIEDSLQELLHGYARHLREHRIAYHTATLEIALKAAPELLENLVKLRFSRLFDAVFGIRRARAELLRQEEAAPGREVAYVYHTAQRFRASP